jgi:hypothetical protein
LESNAQLNQDEVFRTIREAFTSKLATAERIQRLVSFLLGDKSLLKSRFVTLFSHLHKIFKLLLNTTFSNPSSELLVSLYNAAFDSNSVASSPEVCEICDATIPFEQLSSAVCLNGHEFRE